MIKRILIMVLLWLCISCRYDRKDNTLRPKDSIQIFEAALNSKSFLQENMRYSDTLYIIKSKNYHKNYPSSTNYFKLFYIEDKNENKRLNIPGQSVDKRERYEITKFIKRTDTVDLTLYNPGVRESYDYKFICIDDKWTIINEQSSVY